MFNPYGIIAVNPTKYKSISCKGAMQLIAWMTSEEGQRTATFGSPLLRQLLSAKIVLCNMFSGYQSRNTDTPKNSLPHER
jgi:ABC-type glycerol-3-phosphate transport system substrate-binding protein